MDRLREGAASGDRFSSNRQSSRPCVLLPAPRRARLWWTGSTVRADGARTRRGTKMARPRRNARWNCGMPIASGTARDPGRNFRLLSARRLLGSVGGRMGVHLAELHHSVRAWRALRSLQRAPHPDRDLLRRESRRDRPDSPFVLSAREARHGGLVTVGDRGCLFPGDRCSSSRSSGPVCRFGAYRRPVLRLALSPTSCGSFRNGRCQRSSRDRKDRRFPDTGKASSLLPESWVADLWEWFGDRAISGERIGPEYWLA